MTSSEESWSVLVSTPNVQDRIICPVNDVSKPKLTALKILSAVRIATGHCRTQIQDLFEAIEVAHAFNKARTERPFNSLTSSLKDHSFDDQTALQGLIAFVDRVRDERAHSVPTAMRVAGIILAHSHADTMLNNLLAVCVYNDLPYWSKRVANASKRTFTLPQALTINVPEVLGEEITVFLNACRHKSLPNRSQMILSHVGKFGSSSPLSRMSNDDLIAFDNKRHAIVHQNLARREQLRVECHAPCIAVLDHLENLNQSVSEMVGLNWEDVTKSELDRFSENDEADNESNPSETGEQHD